MLLTAKMAIQSPLISAAASAASEDVEFGLDQSINQFEAAAVAAVDSSVTSTLHNPMNLEKFLLSAEFVH